MIWQNRDGELRIVEHGVSGTTYYIEILFVDANLTGPIQRSRTEEVLYTDRGKADEHAGYREAPAASRLAPIPITFSCRTANTAHTNALTRLLSGATVIRGKTLYSRDGCGATSQLAIPQLGTWTTGLPGFADSGKTTYMIQVLWSGSAVSNFGYAWDNVYFHPEEQTITESEDALTLSISGQCYGGVSRLVSFFGGTTNLAVA